VGEIGFADAEGATAPETLRQMYCRDHEALEREVAKRTSTEEVTGPPAIFQVKGQRGHRLSDDCMSLTEEVPL